MKKIFLCFCLFLFLQNVSAQQSIINRTMHEMFKSFFQDKTIENIHYQYNEYRQYRSLVLFFEDLSDFPEVSITYHYNHRVELSKIKPSSIVLYQRMENQHVKGFGYTLKLRKSKDYKEIGITNLLNRVYYMLITKKAYLLKLKDGNLLLKKY